MKRFFSRNKDKNRDFQASGQEISFNAGGAVASEAPDLWKTTGKGMQDVEDAAAEIYNSVSVSTRVNLSFKCHRLPNVDGMFSKTDGFVVAFLSNSEIGRTEVVSNNLNPVFAKSIEATYNFEENQPLEIKVYQAPDNSKSDQTIKIDLKRCLLIGSATCALSDLVTAAGGKKTLVLKGPKGNIPSTLSVVAQEVFSGGENKLVRMALCGHKLDKKDFLGKSDPYYKIHRLYETETGTDEILTFKSEVVIQDLNPIWAPVDLKLSAFGGDLSSPFRMEVYDWDRDGGHDFIGELRTSVQALQSIQGTKNQLELINPKKKGANKVAGYLSVRFLEVVTKPTFLQYITGGCEINFNVAIDFTASNGDPRNPTSLHYVQPYDPKNLNPYQQCILAIADVLQHYDDDQRYPCYGFGAVLSYRNHEKSHCFAINMNETSPEVAGIQGIMAAYNAILPRVKLSGPTCFSEVINAVTARTRANNVSQNSQSYQVLLIVTDGVIQDMPETANAIVAASSLGISIIIVGVGKEDFTNMEILDGDEKRLKGSAGYVERDIVQFVPYRDFVKNGQLDHMKFSKALLEEIPAQLVSYFVSKSIHPNKPKDVETSSEPSMPPTPSSSSHSLYPPPQFGFGVQPGFGGPGNPPPDFMNAGNVSSQQLPGVAPGVGAGVFAYSQQEAQAGPPVPNPYLAQQYGHYPAPVAQQFMPHTGTG